MSFCQIWGSSHYDFVSKVISIREARDSKDRMNTWLNSYIAHFNAYTVAKKLFKMLPHHLDNSGDESEKSNDYLRNKLRIEYKRTITDESLQYIFDLWTVIRKRFTISSVTAFVDSIVQKCLLVTWLIHPSWACSILSEIFGSVSFFREHLMTRIVLGGECVYNEQTGIADHQVSNWFFYYNFGLPFESAKVLVQPNQSFMQCTYN